MSHYLPFLIEVHTMPEQRTPQGRELLTAVCDVNVVEVEIMGTRDYITIDPWFESFKIVIFWKVSTRESVTQNSGFGKRSSVFYALFIKETLKEWKCCFQRLVALKNCILLNICIWHGSNGSLPIRCWASEKLDDFRNKWRENYTGKCFAWILLANVL